MLFEQIKDKIFRENIKRFENRDKIENTIKIVTKIIDEFEVTWRCANCKHVLNWRLHRDTNDTIGMCEKFGTIVTDTHFCKEFEVE